MPVWRVDALLCRAPVKVIAMQCSSEFVCDVDYVVQHRVNGKKVRCPIYAVWDRMRGRCTSPVMKARNPTYTDVRCCPEWLSFSSFRDWAIAQPWHGMTLDKDILLQGNKVYSPSACAFVPCRVNSLFTARKPSGKGLPLGVRASHNGPSSRKPFEALVNKGEGVSVFIGNFETAEKAHCAYLVAKAEVVMSVIEWWRSDKNVSHSFQHRVAEAMASRADALIIAAKSSKQVFSL